MSSLALALIVASIGGGRSSAGQQAARGGGVNAADVEIGFSIRTPEEVLARWTAEAYFSATAPDNRLTTEAESLQTEDREVPDAALPVTLGRRFEGSVEVVPELAERLFPRSWLKGRLTVEGQARAETTGASKLPFASFRPGPQNFFRDEPFRAVGRLFFSTPAGDFVCTGSVIAPRLVLTAGHCVHSGDSRGFYSDFVFVPGYIEGGAPFAVWGGVVWATTPAWVAGKGKLPNSADYAIVEVADLLLNGAPVRLGDVVGWLPVATRSTAPNHVHVLGYPLALDGGHVPHVTTSSSSKVQSQKTYIYGSDMSAGASGGPWLMDFGQAAEGQYPRTRNVIVGVSSYAATSNPGPGQWAVGSSTLDTPLVALFNFLCARQEGNC